MMNPNPIAAIEHEYTAIQTGCAALELADWSSITLTGGDRQAFLHNFCTNDVKRLGPGTVCEAFFPNVKGKVIGHGLVTCREQELVVVGTPGQAERLITHLDRYVIREDVQLRYTTAERAYVLVVGVGNDCHDTAHANRRVDAQSPVKLADKADAAARRHTWPTYAWDLIGRADCQLVECPAQDIPQLRSILAELGATPVGYGAFDTARIEAGVPLFGVDFDDRNLPQEVGRNQPAISFTKGCYLGQETVARIDALGHVNQQIAGVRYLSSAALPAIGDSLTFNGEVAGHVTSATMSPRLRAPLALAMLRRESGHVGSRLDSPVGACEVVALPL